VKKTIFEIFNIYTNNIISVTDAKVLQYTQVKDLERKPNQLIYIYKPYYVKLYLEINLVQANEGFLID
jgi:hypothetical protein